MAYWYNNPYQAFLGSFVINSQFIISAKAVSLPVIIIMLMAISASTARSAPYCGPHTISETCIASLTATTSSKLSDNTKQADEMSKIKAGVQLFEEGGYNFMRIENFNLDADSLKSKNFNITLMGLYHVTSTTMEYIVPTSGDFSKEIEISTASTGRDFRKFLYEKCADITSVKCVIQIAGTTQTCQISVSGFSNPENVPCVIAKYGFGETIGPYNIENIFMGTDMEKVRANNAAFDVLLRHLVGKPAPRSDNTLPPDAPLGAQLTANELDLVTRQIARCWKVPAGAGDYKALIEIHVDLDIDGTVEDASIVDTGRYQSDPVFRAAADSALRAMRDPRCSPLRLPPDKYTSWKTMDLFFSPKAPL